jgi:hypothetical protein
VINHFPETNAQVKERLFEGLSQKAHLGTKIAEILMSLPGANRLGRAYLSWRQRRPGRLYSFLCERAS